MTGKVLTFDSNKGSGIISGENGVRYTFLNEDWKDTSVPKSGVSTDFDIGANNHALDISISVEQNTIQAKTHTSGMAIASLVLGILGIFLLPVIGSIPAVIFGHISRSNIKKSNGQTTGAGMALSGLILGYIVIGIVILGGLVAVVVAPGLMDSSNKAKRDTVCLKMYDLNRGLEMFKLDNGMYPDTEEGFQALTANPDEEKYPNYAFKPYLKRLPTDTWKTPFAYIKNGENFDIISFGTDGRMGGEEDAKDIYFSQCNQ